MLPEKLLGLSGRADVCLDFIRKTEYFTEIEIMPDWKNEAEARAQIKALVADYYKEFKEPAESKANFKPGDRISYASRVYDEKEMQSLTDAVLDFWLTAGRFSKEFEENFAEWLGVKYAHLVNSGSSANLVAFSVLTASELGARQIKRGDEVITVACGFPTTITPILQYGAVQLIEDTRRETVQEFMKMNQYVDVLIPRGGAGLIRTVVENSRIPVIETGTGNCHIFVDESADFDMAIDIIFNAKTQRIGVCNACESLVIHEKIVDAFLPQLKKRLDEKQVEMRGDEKACSTAEGLVPATEKDWGREYLDYILSVKTVKNIDEAIAHINRYNTGHSEAIVTKDYANAQKFLNEIDAAAVYVNASTRFTDGFEFGFGAEIGISTQKLHARGPMGLDALTSGKYIIYGNGQIR